MKSSYFVNTLNPKKSGAWGHKVRPLSSDEIAAQEDSGRRWYVGCQKNVREYDEDPERYKWLAKEVETYRARTQDYCIAYERKCRISRQCKNPSTHMLSYLYVTGQRGNVSMMEKPVCTVHAAKYFTDEQAAEQARILIEEDKK